MHHGIFGDASPRSTKETAVTVGVQGAKALGDSKRLIIEATLPLSGLKNPHFDESVGVVYGHVGLQFGRRVHVRPSAGVAMRLWSGSRVETGFDVAPSLGVAAGFSRSAGSRLDIAPELFVRASFRAGAATAIMGVQVAIGRRAG